MGTTALNWISQIQPAILVLLGTSASIAIFAAVIRHFAYEHDKGDVVTVSTRIMHVFGYILVIAALVTGGTSIAKAFEKAAYVDEINGNTGKSVLPDDYQYKKSDKTLGDLIRSATEQNEKNKINEQDNMYEVTEAESKYKKIWSSNDSDKYDQMREYLATVLNVAKTSQTSDAKKYAKNWLYAKTGKSYSSLKTTTKNGKTVVDIDDATLEKYKDKSM